ncbi:MAG TPA: hypothetical protein VMZ91_03915 [Candidatus Paceibacterota bacterium]|nr:hypothetical protein [Candidatus Paceibacterota bacterium]
MKNWYKKARWQGGTIPLMDDYSDGNVPSSSDHKKDPRGLVNAKPEFGGNERPGYPKGISQNSENSDDPTWAKLHGTIPGEAVLMDDGGDSQEGLGDRFVSQDEFNTDNDKLPIGETEKSVQLDTGDVGPHNMQKGNIFNKIKNKTKIKGLRL